MPDIFINAEEETPKPKKDHKGKGGGEKHSSHEDSRFHNHNPVSAFCYYPHDVDFVNQEPDEEVILLVRRHPFTNTGWILLTILMVLAPFALNFLPILAFLPARFQLVAILIWYLLTLAIFIQGFLSWFFSVNIITNKRVIDVDFENLIYRKVTDAEISHIEDVTVTMGSVVRTIFDYGDVLIQTAGAVPDVEFNGVPHPDQIDKILSDLRMRDKE